MHLHTYPPCAIIPALDWLAGLLHYGLSHPRYSRRWVMWGRNILTPCSCLNVPLYSRMRHDLLGERLDSYGGDSASSPGNANMVPMTQYTMPRQDAARLQGQGNVKLV